ncbi:hypothetical protein LIER_26485 [Lithospermum erythrorhizon]|uniref:Reverse transcriptase zinc-binding domain-containing protein n=1 Tax=Lithospermum erythrorhizon TaxID=34254 RepID=A0AAV3R8J3_LITER
MWLLCNGKLQTKDKLLQWSVVDNDNCVLCGWNESVNHLFFSCEFSSQVWRKMLYTNNFHIPNSWDQKLQKIYVDGVDNDFPRRLFKLVISSAVYAIWSERNQRIFQQKCVEMDCIVACITRIVRNRVDAWRGVSKTRKNWLLFIEWGFSISIFEH